MIERLVSLLSELGSDQRQLLSSHDIDPAQFAALFRAAVESIRGTFAATTEPKRRFIQAVLDEMRQQGLIESWESIASAGRLDYRVTMPGGRKVAIEGKGCPDGNNMNIWDVQPWADEVVVWSQCADSLAHDPGVGVWSGIAIRLVPESVARNKRVDALVFFDGRCGSLSRRCPKQYGVAGDLRSRCTDLPGQDEGWIPPPCIYMFPRTIAHPTQNPEPPVHDFISSQFAAALLTAFGVPAEEWRHQAHWVRPSAQARSDGTYIRVQVGWDLDNAIPSVDSGWKKLRR